MGSVTPHFEEYPPQASLEKDVYRPLPALPADFSSSSSSKVDNPAALVSQALDSLSAALGSGDVGQVKASFLGEQSYWRDLLAFTWHLRTFYDGGTIAPAFVELAKARSGGDGSGGDFHFQLDQRSAKDVTISPTLRWIEGLFTFETKSPAARCGGQIMLFPEPRSDGGFVWKIWTLSTWIDDLVESPQDMSALQAPKRELDDADSFETDVLVLGGGNAGIILSARLKALGLDSVIVDRNRQAGDNWALRYDCLRFHIAKSNCETPYLSYPEEDPIILTREHLARHMKRYASTFNLNILHSSAMEGASFHKATKTWKIKLRTPSGPKTVKAKHLVQATGIGGAEPYVPELPGEKAYQGVNIHSAEYKNPKVLSDKGVKSVIVVGSANSAFDIMEDCAANGLKTTMNARSPTYIFPWDYVLEGMSIYDTLGAEIADKIQMSGPNGVGGQLVVGSYAAKAAKEPNRYKALAAAGFPVYDSVGGKGNLFHHLLERGGGHFNDIGEGVEFIVSGKVAVKGGVHPVAYTETGLEFSDGSRVDADAIVWCTGFRDKDRAVTAAVLGGKRFDEVETNGTNGEVADAVLGPQDIAAQRDAVWGVDKEGEVRGVFKRHLRLDNFWIFGGTTAMHRYYSLPLALQIKAAVEGILPEAYRGTPEA